MCVHRMDELLGKIGSNITRLCQGICSCILLCLTSAGDRSCSSHQSCTIPQAMLQALCHKTHNTLFCTAGACSHAPRVEAVTELQLSGCACISTHLLRQLLLHDRPGLPWVQRLPSGRPAVCTFLLHSISMAARQRCMPFCCGFAEHRQYWTCVQDPASQPHKRVTAC